MSFRLKENEIMFFIDFNNTLVDYENEYDHYAYLDDLKTISNPGITKSRLVKCLMDFESKTGLTPVICVVTNAESTTIDANGYPGIFHDLRMTFFNYSYTGSNVGASNPIEKYFKYLIYKDNNAFFTINPRGQTLEEMFVGYYFDEEALSIRYAPSFRKKESVERMMSIIDPTRDTSKFIVFAGDTIKDDYPMKEIETPHGVSKIFIRPGKSKKLTYMLMREFAESKGHVFSCLNRHNGKRIKNIDQFNYMNLSDQEQQWLNDYHSGDYVILAQKNNRGLVDGIYEAADFIEKKQREQGVLGG